MFLLHMLLHQLLEHINYDIAHLVQVLKQIRQWIQKLPIRLGKHRYVVYDVVIWRIAIPILERDENEHEFTLALLHRCLFALLLEVHHNISLVV